MYRVHRVILFFLCIIFCAVPLGHTIVLNARCERRESFVRSTFHGSLSSLVPLPQEISGTRLTRTTYGLPRMFENTQMILSDRSIPHVNESISHLPVMWSMRFPNGQAWGTHLFSSFKAVPGPHEGCCTHRAYLSNFSFCPQLGSHCNRGLRCRLASNICSSCNIFGLSTHSSIYAFCKRPSFLIRCLVAVECSSHKHMSHCSPVAS